MDSFAYVAPWVMASVFIGIIVGVFLGRGRGLSKGRRIAAAANRATTKVLAQVLGVAETMAQNIETHNEEIRANHQQMNELPVSGEMVGIKRALMRHVNELMESNKHLQEDLTLARYRLEEQNQEIDHARREARCDSLTGVANRRSFDEKLHLLLDDWRKRREPFVLILVDLDYFKRINDAHSHQAGDRVLKAAAEGLKRLSRKYDFVGRYGGDEFALLLPKTTLEVGRSVAEAIRGGITAKAFNVVVSGGAVAISLSMGVTAAIEGDTDESILRRSDVALYRCKNAGRNQVQCIEGESEPALA